MECGIVICSRLGSSRLPGKVLTEINGKPLLRHLVDRLPKEMPIIVATPLNESEEYQKFFYNEVLFFEGDRLDPMVRMLKAAEHYDLKYIVRITHDKIFVDKDEIHRAYNAVRKREVDYHIDALRSACEQYKKVEHISYAIKAVTNNTLKYRPSTPKSDHRLLIDFPEDLDLMLSRGFRFDADFVCHPGK
jgi:spore coat polysaccharide biosynthesis protein SpsF (cytidylyltransferase family)